MKRILAVLLSSIMILSLSVAAFADGDITVTFDGNGYDGLYDEAHDVCAEIVTETFAAGRTLDDSQIVSQCRRNAAILPGTTKVFAGWSTSLSEDDIISEYYGDYNLTENVTFHAIWVQGIPVTFHATGGTGFDESYGKDDVTVYTGYVVPGTEIGSNWGLYEPTIYGIPDNMDRLGWSLTEGSNELADGYVINAPIDLYAVLSNTVKVILDANGSTFEQDWTMDPETGREVSYYPTTKEYYYPAGKKLGERIPSPLDKDGVPCCGYAESANGQVMTWGGELRNYVVQGNVTLYAQYGYPELLWFHSYPEGTFDGKEEYVYAHSCMRGNGISELKDLKPIALDDHFEFDHWSASRDGDDPIDVETYTVTTSTDIYAKWKEYRFVTFDANGGYFSTATETSVQKKVLNGNRATEIPTANNSDEDLVFDYWALDSKGEQTVDLAEYVPGTDVTVFAIYKSLAAEAAKAVETLMKAAFDEESVATAEAAYEALNDAAKALVSEDAKKALEDTKKRVEEEKALGAALTVETMMTSASDEESVAAADAAYEALSDAAKAFIPDEVKSAFAEKKARIAEEKQVAADAQVVVDLMLAANDEESVVAAEAAYGALSDKAKALVSDEAKAALENTKRGIEEAKAAAAAQAVEALMVAANDEESVTAAETAYAALSDAAKALVSDEAKQALANTKKGIEEAKAAADAQAVEALMKAANDEKSVAEAESAYEALSDAAKALISDEAKNALANTKKGIEEAKALADAQAVEALMKAAKDEKSVAEAEAAYAALSDKAKAMVGDEAKNALANTKKGIEDAKVLAAAQAVEALMKAAKDEKSVAEAEKAYAALSDKAKALVGDEAKKALATTKQKIEDAKKAEQAKKEAAAEKKAEAIKKFSANVKKNATIPLKVKQTSKAVKILTLASGDKIKSVTNSNKNAVTVSRSGNTLILKAGKKKGTSTIKVTTANGASLTFKVSVKTSKVTTKSIKVPKTSVTVKKGKTIDLGATLDPITSTDKIKYSSAKKSIATVNSKGVVKGKNPGKVKITITAGNKKKIVTVTVKK